jgi:metal-sulfur cluster biosynthetic enzyme
LATWTAVPAWALGKPAGPVVLTLRGKVSTVPNVSAVAVELTFDPPWNSEMMSEAARLQTGMY